MDGISVKASQTVDPKALEAGADTVHVMLAHRPDIARRMAEAGAALAIVPRDMYITEIPELGYLKGQLDLNGNPYDSFTVLGAGGIPQQPTTVTFWAEDITVHEWAHAIENLGFNDETRTKWRDLFDQRPRKKTYFLLHDPDPRPKTAEAQPAERSQALFKTQ